MNRIDFDCTFDLADTITALLGDINDDYPSISVYGKYEVIKELLEDLIMSGVVIANEIELHDYDIDYYDKEFVLYLSKDGINVEKTYNTEDKCYLYGGGNISFIHEDCSSKLLKYVDSKIVYEFGIDGCDCDECECDDYEDDDDEGYTVNGISVTKDEFDEYVSQFRGSDVKLVTTSTTTYKVNGKEVDKSEFDKEYEKFEEKYLDNIRDMLLNYCEFMDEVNEWRKLFRW